jgi:hypothetical protein
VGIYRPAVLLLDGGVEKSSTISGFRVLCFWLFLVLYLSQACLQLLSRVSGLGDHEVCGSLSIAILDLSRNILIFSFISSMTH